MWVCFLLQSAGAGSGTKKFRGPGTVGYFKKSTEYLIASQVVFEDFSVPDLTPADCKIQDGCQKKPSSTQ